MFIPPLAHRFFTILLIGWFICVHCSHSGNLIFRSSLQQCMRSVARHIEVYQEHTGIWSLPNAYQWLSFLVSHLPTSYSPPSSLICLSFPWSITSLPSIWLAGIPSCFSSATFFFCVKLSMMVHVFSSSLPHIILSPSIALLPTPSMLHSPMCLSPFLPLTCTLRVYSLLHPFCVAFVSVACPPVFVFAQSLPPSSVVLLHSPPHSSP